MRVLRFWSKKFGFCLIILFAHASIDAFLYKYASIDPFIKNLTRFSDDIPRNIWDSWSIDGIISSIDHILTVRSILVIDRCVFGYIYIDRSVYKKTYEILFSIDHIVTPNPVSSKKPRNIPRKFRGTPDILYRSMRFVTYIHRSIRLKKLTYWNPKH